MYDLPEKNALSLSILSNRLFSHSLSGGAAWQSTTRILIIRTVSLATIVLATAQGSTL